MDDAVVIAAIQRAVEAVESAKSAHQRLDRMNGSIDRLGGEVAASRSLATDEFKALRTELAALKTGEQVISTKLAIYGAIGIALAGGLGSLLGHALG